ncbi:MAG: hypothetical protein LBT46_05505 [Planctomycetaceae bacterium]|nr:hypothetical protein [Planctomycetaceae bacterium]
MSYFSRFIRYFSEKPIKNAKKRYFLFGTDYAAYVQNGAMTFVLLP